MGLRWHQCFKPNDIKMIIRRRHKSIIVFGLIILIFMIFFGSRIFQTIKSNMEVGKKIIDLKRNISDLEKQNNKLKDFIANFRKESYIEKEAKARLDLKKPGENVVVIIEEEIKKTENEIKNQSTGLKKIFQDIKDSFSQWK